MAITQIASLATVKQYLRIPNPTGSNPDDATLQVLMAGATEAIEKEVGHIIPARITNDKYDGGDMELWLRELPVLYIVNVEEGWGYYNWELDDQEVNSQPALSIWSYSLDNPREGLITRRGPGNVQVPFVHGRNNIRVDYVVGRNSVPGNAALAFCELVSIWYRQSQQRAAAGNTEAIAYNASDTQSFTRATGDTSINFGVPYAILEMLKGSRRRPIIG